MSHGDSNVLRTMKKIGSYRSTDLASRGRVRCYVVTIVEYWRPSSKGYYVKNSILPIGILREICIYCIKHSPNRLNLCIKSLLNIYTTSVGILFQGSSTFWTTYSAFSMLYQLVHKPLVIPRSPHTGALMIMLVILRSRISY